MSSGRAGPSAALESIQMARLALKPDSSFFRKIVIGAVGARSICSDLAMDFDAGLSLGPATEAPRPVGSVQNQLFE
jgi:hypothetical protein